jgi:hypothetical protein
MMKFLVAPLVLSGLFFGSVASIEDIPVRCMIQMKNYDGEGAYIIAGLVDENGDYLRTLHVVGDDDEWHYELEEWWKFHGRTRPSIDGITGPTIAGGERTTFVFDVRSNELDRGYGIRFESGVENEGYFPREVIIPLVSDMSNGKREGDGFIRYVRLLME